MYQFRRTPSTKSNQDRITAKRTLVAFLFDDT